MKLVSDLLVDLQSAEKLLYFVQVIIFAQTTCEAWSVLTCRSAVSVFRIILLIYWWIFPLTMKKTTASKGKAKRWRKGHSSSSNPETKKHREAAKGRFLNTLSSSTAGMVWWLWWYDDDDDDVICVSLCTCIGWLLLFCMVWLLCVCLYSLGMVGLLEFCDWSPGRVTAATSLIIK